MAGPYFAAAAASYSFDFGSTCLQKACWIRSGSENSTKRTLQPGSARAAFSFRRRSAVISLTCARKASSERPLSLIGFVRQGQPTREKSPAFAAREGAKSRGKETSTFGGTSRGSKETGVRRRRKGETDSSQNFPTPFTFATRFMANSKGT